MNCTWLVRSLDEFSTLNSLKQIHALSVTLGFLPNLQSFACKLIESYKNLGKVREAQNIFNQIQSPDIVSWASLLNLYLHSNLPAKSLAVFSLYIDAGFRPDGFLVVGALSSCGRGKDLIRGRAIHAMTLRNHLDENSIVGNALIDMYCRNGKIELAFLVFKRKRLKDIFSWTTLFNGYILSDDLHSAREVFDEMPERNSVSWTAMISGYVKGGAPVQALELFQKMEVHLCSSVATLIVVILSACADTGALHFGLSIHGNVSKTKLELDVTVKNALMGMYSKSGRLDLATKLFNEISEKDVFSWTTMISSYADHGKGQEALKIYSQMLAESKVTPNEVTFLSLLTACSHSGLVLEAKMLFKRMIHCHGLEPNIQHYGSLVDLLGRAGFVEEAKEMIENMPIEPDGAIWRSLLTACLSHGNLKLAVMAGRKVIELEPSDHDGVYMILWNVYFAANMWKEALEIRKMMKASKVRRKPGSSWVEVNGIVQEFHVDDR